MLADVLAAQKVVILVSLLAALRADWLADDWDTVSVVSLVAWTVLHWVVW